MTQPRLYKRVRPIGKMASVSKIVVEPKLPVINCANVDYSAGGACLEVGAGVVLPNRFELISGSAREKCRTVWSRGIRVGVAF
jgi:hypothetical protein